MRLFHGRLVQARPLGKQLPRAARIARRQAFRVHRHRQVGARASQARLGSQLHRWRDRVGWQRRQWGQRRWYNARALLL